MKEFSVKLAQKNYKVVDESGHDDVNIYIPGLFQLMLIDKKDSTDDFLGDIHDDIVKSRVHVYKYSLFGKEVFDFNIENSNWSDYPRPESIGRFIIKRLGKKASLGYLEIIE